LNKYINYAETHLFQLHGTRVHVQDNEDEFDRELFEPTHDCWDGEEDAMDAGHGLHTGENDNDDDGVIQRPPQGKASFIVQMLNLFLQSLIKTIIAMSKQAVTMSHIVWCQRVQLELMCRMLIHMTLSTRICRRDIN
jgi:hypothetical protein